MVFIGSARCRAHLTSDLSFTPFVAGQTPRSLAAIANLRAICSEHVGERYHLEVIDLLKNPTLAKDHQILAIPPLVRRLPKPICKIIGDLSDTERVLVGLDIRETKPPLARAKSA